MNIPQPPDILSDYNRVPLISVIVPTRNRPIEVARAVRSVLAQTYQNLEVLVVDDASDVPVDLANLQLPVQRPLIRLFRSDTPLGGGEARNLGIRASHGEFVCFLDDDDTYERTKLECLLNALRQQPEYNVAFGKVLMNDGHRTCPPVRYPPRFSPMLNLRLMNLVHTNATLIHRSCLQQVSFLRELTRFQDLQFHIELSLSAKLLFVDEIVAEWRVDGRPDQVTTASSAEKRRQDTRSFATVIEYFETTLKIDHNLLAIYYAKLARMYFETNQLRAGIKVMLTRLLSPKVMWRLVADLSERRTYFLRNR